MPPNKSGLMPCDKCGRLRNAYFLYQHHHIELWSNEPEASRINVSRYHFGLLDPDMSCVLLCSDCFWVFAREKMPLLIWMLESGMDTDKIDPLMHDWCLDETARIA